MTSQQFSLFENEEPLAAPAVVEPEVTPSGKFSNFVVYVDESGDHGMETVDDNYPVFVLAFCVFHKRHYSEKVVPALQKFKFNHFGHDLAVLHEHEIRKEKGDFRFQTRQHKQDFLVELTSIIEASNFILISCVIDKEQLRSKPGVPPNPYHLALGFCLETLYELLQEKNQDDKLTHVVVECRGKKEDNELELEFRRICDGSNRWGRPLPFDVKFADKKVNLAGLQLADLVARPIGLRVLRPEQENRAFDVLKRKFFCCGGRKNVGEGFENWGLKIYPLPESEKPR
ncbi:DUF3800 domain-containing protein [Rhodoferax sp. UBA5149]|uniref:DUF3800 domain-containing protein n=1 Tax=Rhodoferax sp. UBA5149 TaxID=1947379 RepID=UPI0025E490DD|nr:DUF3800 domain-containing protein [Rhodoferax sp. UBA5149]